MDSGVLEAMKIGKGSLGKLGVQAVNKAFNGGQQQGGQHRHGQGRSTTDIRVQKMMHDRMTDSFERPATAIDHLKGASAKVLQSTKEKANRSSSLQSDF